MNVENMKNTSQTKLTDNVFELVLQGNEVVKMQLQDNLFI